MSRPGDDVPRIRKAALPADAVIVVRGEDLSPGMSKTQAERFRRRYPGWGRWGLSAFYARNDGEVEDLAGGPLRRYEMLSVFRVAALEAAGYEVIPTFRTPHVTIAFTGDLNEGLERLRLAVHDERANPYHGPDSPRW